MNGLVAILLLAAMLAAGCTTKADAQRKAQDAYLRGRMIEAQQAEQQRQQAATPAVTVLGEVRNQIVPWIEGITLPQAIASAQYTGARQPKAVILRHGNEAARFDIQFILQNGQAIPLEPGDVIELVR